MWRVDQNPAGEGAMIHRKAPLQEHLLMSRQLSGYRISGLEAVSSLCAPDDLQINDESLLPIDHELNLVPGVQAAPQGQASDKRTEHFPDINVRTPQPARSDPFGIQKMSPDSFPPSASSRVLSWLRSGQPHPTQPSRTGRLRAVWGQAVSGQTDRALGRALQTTSGSYGHPSRGRPPAGSDPPRWHGNGDR